MTLPSTYSKIGYDFKWGYTLKGGFHRKILDGNACGMHCLSDNQMECQSQGIGELKKMALLSLRQFMRNDDVVFICYHKNDYRIADNIYDALEGEGISYWLKAMTAVRMPV